MRPAPAHAARREANAMSPLRAAILVVALMAALALSFMDRQILSPPRRAHQGGPRDQRHQLRHAARLGLRPFLHRVRHTAWTARRPRKPAQPHHLRHRAMEPDDHGVRHGRVLRGPVRLARRRRHRRGGAVARGLFDDRGRRPRAPPSLALGAYNMGSISARDWRSSSAGRCSTSSHGLSWISRRCGRSRHGAWSSSPLGCQGSCSQV